MRTSQNAYYELRKGAANRVVGEAALVEARRKVRLNVAIRKNESSRARLAGFALIS
jgi:hypothetical protein